METDLLSLLSLAIYNPGSDLAYGLKLFQVIWGRSGNETLIGLQPVPAFPNPNPPPQQLDILIGDLVIDDPLGREWIDTFVLGDWEAPYYANGSPFTLGLNDVAVIVDFDPEQDFIQLYGDADNYQLLSIDLPIVGQTTAIAFEKPGGIDIVGVLLGTSNLSLDASYFRYRGTTPPPGPVIPQINQFGTLGLEVAPGVIADPEGNVYVVGSTNGSLEGESNLGGRDAFIRKYDPQGRLLFTKQLGTSGYEEIFGIGIDNEGNLYVSGLTDSAFGGPKQAEQFDAFVAKFDSEGNQLWIRQVGENIQFPTFNLAVNPETGDAFISGPNVSGSLENPDDTFVIRFDTNGNQIWQTDIGVSGFLNFDEAYGITVDQNGDVYTTGWTNGNLGGVNQGLYDGWVSKLDQATGEVQWISQYGSSDYDWAWDVATDSQNSVYTTGFTLGNLGGANAGQYDAYLTKFNSEGALQWIRQFGASGDDQARNLLIDSEDNIFLTGYTTSNLGGQNAGLFDAFVAKFDTDGNQIWITQFGTPDRDDGLNIAKDSFGNLFVSGDTGGSLGATSSGSFDAWVAKLDPTTGSLLDFSGTLVAEADTASTLENAAVQIDVLANDTIADDNFTLSIVTPPAQGTAVVNNNNTAQDPGDDFIVFTPESHTTGTFEFTYQLDKSNGLSSTATVSVTVTPDVEPPLPLAPGIIDLRNIDLDSDGKVDSIVNLSFNDIFSEALYNNSVGLYVIQDQEGSVMDSLTGQLLRPGDAGYTTAALQQRLPGIEIDRNTGTVTTPVQGGLLLSPYVIANGTTEQFLAQNASNQNFFGQLPNAYFIFLGANPDKVNHFKQVGNSFAFEDLWGGGDNDFNDLMFQVAKSKPEMTYAV